MGLLWSGIMDRLFGKKEFRILILGLDNAGKTTILYKLSSPDKVIRTRPTIGFNVESVEYKNLTFNVWDLDVVDSQDRERVGLARKELMSMLQEEELKDAALLVFANKQDMKGALTEVEISQALGLHSIRDRSWHICRSVATQGDGLSAGLDWISDTLTGKK